jgi:hypothetical protein
LVVIIAIEYLIVCLIFGGFLVAGILELRHHKLPRPLLLLRLVEIAVGLASLWGAVYITRSRSLSWTMVCFWIVLGVISAMSKYASRFALFCVLVGNAALACLWYFKGF